MNKSRQTVRPKMRREAGGLPSHVFGRLKKTKGHGNAMRSLKLAILASAVSVFGLCACAEQKANTVTCDANSNVLAAHYEITDHAANNGGHAKFSLWRDGQDTVAHQHEDAGVVDVWHKRDDAHLQLIRYFDADKEAIEYFPGDIPGSGRGMDWPGKFTLLSKDMLSGMKKTSSEGEGCDLKEMYRLEKDDKALEIIWRPALELIEAQTLTQHGESQTWTLTSLTSDAAKVAAFFTAREDYHATDYADIGDNESDPFFRKMIRLGFVDHGASGFYNADGSAVNGGGAHQH